MNMFRRFVFLFAALGALLCSCGGRHAAQAVADAGEPAFLDIFERPQGGWTVVSVSPFDGSKDSLVVDRPLRRLIVMSTSHYGFLDALGRTDLIVGASGVDYLFTDQSVTENGYRRQSLAVRTPRSARPLPSLGESVKTSLPSLSVDLGPSLLHDEGVHGPDLPDLPPDSNPVVAASLDGETTATLGTLRGGTGAERSGASGGAERSEAVEPPELAATAGIVDVGYDGAADYERIMELEPDVVLTYAVSGAKSPFVSKLEQLGIKVFTVNEHLERHPLARASYIRLFGALSGEMAAADSILSSVKESYNALASSVSGSGGKVRKVLLNIPYNDQWFVPSTESYLTALIHDAGGEVLGCETGKAASSVMSVEKAYTLSEEADCWLNTGWCNSKKDLLEVNTIFTDMLGNIERNAKEAGIKGPVVWNDNNRVNPKGGNDIWQSGVARPDLVLRDLVGILHPTDPIGETIYYKSID